MSVALSPYTFGWSVTLSLKLYVALSLCPVKLVGLSLTQPVGLSLIYYLSVCHACTICRFATHMLSLVLSLYYHPLCHAYCVSLCHAYCVSLSRQPAHRLTLLSINFSHVALIPYAAPSRCTSPTLNFRPAQSDPTGYLTHLHCHTHALGKHNQCACHTLTLASIQGIHRAAQQWSAE